MRMAGLGQALYVASFERSARISVFVLSLNVAIWLLLLHHLPRVIAHPTIEATWFGPRNAIVSVPVIRIAS